MKSIKSTQVILLYNISKLGKISSVVSVKAGYAKNYLVPNGLVLYATKQNILDFEANKDSIEKQNAEKSDIALKVKSILTDKFFTFVCNASDDGRLYGSVSMKDIADSVNKEIIKNGITNFVIHPSKINTENGIKFIGSHVVKISIYDNVESEVSVITCRSESDVTLYTNNKENLKQD